jgi:transposase
MPPRQIFSAIVYVLRTGCQWKALPREFGSASAVHLHFQKWQQAGFSPRMWQVGLAEYYEMEAIAWNWQTINGAMHKAPLATECVGPNGEEDINSMLFAATSESADRHCRLSIYTCSIRSEFRQIHASSRRDGSWYR